MSSAQVIKILCNDVIRPKRAFRSTKDVHAVGHEIIAPNPKLNCPKKENNFIKNEVFFIYLF